MAGVLVVCGALLVTSIVGLALRKGCRADGVYQNDSPHFGSVESYGAIESSDSPRGSECASDGGRADTDSDGGCDSAGDNGD